MAGAPPAETPFLSALLSCDLEIVTPLRAASSVCNRGSVQFGRSVTGADRTSRAKPSAASLLTGVAPVCGLARNPSTPSAMNHVRPASHTVRRYPECPCDLPAGPSARRQQNGPSPVRLIATHRKCQRLQLRSIFRRRHNPRPTNHDPLHLQLHPPERIPNVS